MTTAADLAALITDVAALLVALRDSDIVELEIASESARLRVRRRAEVAAASAATAAQEGHPLTATGYVAVAAPLAGVFYRRPAPTERPFVEVGDVVVPGQVICLIEAMKIFNEIRSELAGRIVEIPVADGQTVTPATELFLLEPLEGPAVLPLL